MLEGKGSQVRLQYGNNFVLLCKLVDEGGGQFTFLLGISIYDFGKDWAKASVNLQIF